ncbi:hypothetical protein PsYK624_049790 [Phanerochaete sordida]|uniref:Uncharacterized protein n=1 Tax=Phanerochaete sordida TaxID=48140 RepID=A0A9P3G6C7_9APHY|nr:hypothetical protein PsYK624_049790 [Phanerochaete sordida]
MTWLKLSSSFSSGRQDRTEKRRHRQLVVNMKAAAPFVIVAALFRGAAAVAWKQYYYEDCSGTVENSGSESNSYACVPQQGASVSFTKTDGISCEIGIHGDNTCSSFLYDVGDGCYTFGGTGRSFTILCGE